MLINIMFTSKVKLVIIKEKNNIVKLLMIKILEKGKL